MQGLEPALKAYHYPQLSHMYILVVYGIFLHSTLECMGRGGSACIEPMSNTPLLGEPLASVINAVCRSDFQLASESQGGKSGNLVETLQFNTP